MVQIKTKLIIADNSGGKYARCIRVYDKKYGNLCDFIVVTLLIFDITKKLVKKRKYIGLLISVKRWKSRLNGIYLRYSRNRMILFQEHDKFGGTRIYGPLCRELRNKSLFSRFKKLLSYAKRII
jgi:large subunit ribosomal protein L14